MPRGPKGEKTETPPISVIPFANAEASLWISSGRETAETYLQLLHRSITLLRCGFTPVYALLGRFLPRLKAASGRPPFWR